MDVLLAFMALFYVAYVLYGRTKKKSLVGNYKPGVAGYDVFIKLIGNKYLVISLALSSLFIVNAFLDARRVLDGESSHSVLIVAPIGVLVLFGLSLAVSSKLFLNKK